MWLYNSPLDFFNHIRKPKNKICGDDFRESDVFEGTVLRTGTARNVSFKFELLSE